MISFAIIEDDKHTVTMLQDIVSNKFTQTNYMGTASTIIDGIKLIKDKQPDFIFLDVHLEDGKSFEILKHFKEPNFKVVFITSHSNYAIEAFKFSALDFVLKPFTTNDIIDAVNNVLEQFDTKKYTQKIKTLFHNYASSQKKIILSNVDDIHIVALDDIIYAQSDNNYTTFYIVDGRKILVSKPLKLYEEKLVNQFFFRIHQKYLINLNYIKKYDKREDNIVLNNDVSLSVSLSKKKQLLEILTS